MPEFDPTKQLDSSKPLMGTASMPWKHVLHLTHGHHDFHTMPSRIEMIPGSLSSEIAGLKRDLVSPAHPVLVSNVLLADHAGQELVYVYPDHKAVRFDIRHTKDFIRKYLVPADYTPTPVYNPFVKTEATQPAHSKDPPVDGANFTEYELDRDLVLICGHTLRDERCGKLAPLLQDEFERVFAREGLEGDIGLVSHIGGHVYAGNVILYSQHKHRDSVWYGRVFPDRVQGVVHETVMRGKVITELYRGPAGPADSRQT
ncbi:uncharacterized protein CANTADRAFT_88503 [Suhomyces tanzawaensis NRRL Y-17324]|uniref:Altered inheritance of mitochondria protein 32 n=1 Tax=Suhomyces tanzawaensis NRRL Y-17324 TaxID=984487 RepID=A0A1E4SM20_9ASCO|nr:uncharacterized protein CANTADRAFT_88503 [Suhomyces tanzawaensis NRRL Y-17324]ODV80574.1 hypothetical protein CANTADRAFT_88503 [Suhomyces tanzawaensis NRRL Y-17324]